MARRTKDRNPKMDSPRRTSSIVVKRALLAGAALAAFWPAAVAAQPPLRTDRGQPLNTNPDQPAARPPTAAPANNDGLKPGELYMEADQLIRDDRNGRTTAQGSVEVRYDGRTLRADRLVYEQGRNGQQGVIRAYGHVKIINDDGTSEYADQFTLDDKMQAGVALGFSARLQQEVKLAAASVVRRSVDVQELNKAIYTPCPICVGDAPKTPTWSISADRVVEDKTRRVIYYRNARIHVLGAPLLYLPVFWHADPSAERSSGLLAPRIGASGRRGFSYEQPYLQVLSPYSDLTVSPQINTKINPFLNVEYRKRFYSGSLDVRMGYTHDADVDGKGNRFGTDTSRSYILGRGAFRIDDRWLWGFTAERTSDNLIFDKYDVGRVYQARGPYVPDDRRLISQVYAVRQDDRSYISTAAFSIQGLRPGDNNRTFPLVAPLIEDRYEAPDQLFGGRLRLNVDAVALTRDQSTDPATPALAGIDSRRASGGFDWSRVLTSPGGLRVAPFVQGRFDAYSLSDVPTGTAAKVHSYSTARALGVAGADISYPLYRRWDNATVVLEPLAQVAVSPDVRQVSIGRNAATGKPIYLDEDSVVFEFDETTLFKANKFPGFDLYEGGARLNVGGRTSILWDDGRRASLLIGRSFRDSPNRVFSAGSGLTGRASDWIVAGDAQPVRGFSLFARTRLDADTLEVHRLEAGANVSAKWGSGYIRYLTDDQGVAGQGKIANMDLGGDLNLSQHWGVSAYGNRDLIQNAWVIRDLGVFYKDDCIRVDVLYRREDVIIGRSLPGNQLSVRLTLATLGAPLYGR